MFFELWDEEYGKYMHNVRTEIVRVKQEKQSNNANNFVNPVPKKGLHKWEAEHNEWKKQRKQKRTAY